MTDIATSYQIDPINRETFMGIIKKNSLEQLYEKLKLGDFICNSLKDDPDPRAPGAIARMRREQEWIQDEIAERKRAERAERGGPEPPVQVIGLKTLKYSGKLQGAINNESKF
jgi:hypothetical protein